MTSLLQSQSEQSGSEQDSAVESPLVDSVDSDSQQVVIFHMDVNFIFTFTLVVIFFIDMMSLPFLWL